MFGLRNKPAITKELDEATDEINRLTLRVAELRKELAVAGKDPEIQAILDKQPIGSTLRDGTPAEPEEVIKERLGIDRVSLWHAGDITDTYIHLQSSLNVNQKNVDLPPFGDNSMKADSVMRKLYASETLRELLRYKNDAIGKFITIDQNGYVSLLR